LCKCVVEQPSNYLSEVLMYTAETKYTGILKELLEETLRRVNAWAMQRTNMQKRNLLCVLPIYITEYATEVEPCKYYVLLCL